VHAYVYYMHKKKLTFCVYKVVYLLFCYVFLSLLFDFDIFDLFFDAAHLCNELVYDFLGFT